jgi:alpha-tubulin suppressor-like RCC1 family protein
MASVKLVIIDTRVSDYQHFVDSLQTGVSHVLLDFYNDTYSSLLTKISALGLSSIESVALVSHSVIGTDYQMLSSAQVCKLPDVMNIDPSLSSWSEWIQFWTDVGAPIIDLLGCAIYMDDNWKYVLNTLESQMSVDFRASVDDTGALALGGNWVLESDNVNIKDVYFTESIEGWLGLLRIVIGVLTSAVIDVSGRLYTCGDNQYVQLGHNDLSNRNIFTLVQSLSNEIVTQVSVGTGEHCLACITSTGKLYTWGSGVDGKLGHGDTINKNLPTQVMDLSNRNIVSVKCGVFNIICLDSSGYVYSAGNIQYLNRGGAPSNRFGRVIGSSTNVSNSISNENITQIDSGGVHFAALSSTRNNLYLWGWHGGDGRLGTTSNSSTYTGPSNAPDLIRVTNVKKVFCGSVNTAIVDISDRLIVMGVNSAFQLRSDTSANITNRTTYYDNSASAIYSNNVNSVVFGHNNIYVLNNNGNRYFSGNNTSGWSGLGSSNTTTPLKPNTETILPLNINSIISNSISSTNNSNIYTMIIDNSNNLRVIGKNSFGQLGTGNTTDRNNLTDISLVRLTRGLTDPTTTGIKFAALADSGQLIFPPTITYTSHSVSFGTSGSASPTIVSNGGDASITYDVSGVLPSGVSLNQSTGVISWSTSVAVGSYSIIITATNSSNTPSSTVFSLTVTLSVPSNLTFSVSSSFITYKEAGSSVTPTVNNGGETVTFSLGGNVPSGVTINPTTGVISWN